MKEISKELFEEVTGYLNMVEDIEVIDDKIGYSEYSINIYKLADKCKKWAYQNFKLGLISGQSAKNIFFCSMYNDANCMRHGVVDNTEIEAVFKLCEWILNNIKRIKDEARN